MYMVLLLPQLVQGELSGFYTSFGFVIESIFVYGVPVIASAVKHMLFRPWRLVVGHDSA